MQRNPDFFSHDALIEEASHLLVRDPGQAGTMAAATLRQAPADPRGLLILASSKRRLGDPAAAKTILAALAARFPSAALTQYELGLAHAALAEADQAIAALERAATLRPDLSGAWKALGDLLFEAGDERRASAAFAQYERSTVASPALKPMADLLLAGRLSEAEQALLAHLARHEDDVEALHLLARTLSRQHRDAEAEVLFDIYLLRVPDDEGAAFSRAEVLFRRNKARDALAAIRGLLVRQPDLPAYRNLLAAALALSGAYDEALGVYEGLLERYGRQPRLWLNYGHALRTVGRRDEAMRAYRQAIRLRADLGEAYWSLANLKNVRFTAAEEAAMRDSAVVAATDDDRIHFHYALGKACEDREDYRASFEHYSAGAALRRTSVPYDAGRFGRRIAATKELATAAFFAERQGGGYPSKAPIFVLGLPRSGSTLVEQILASHSAIEGTMELPDIGLIAAEIASGSSSFTYLEALSALTPGQRHALGREYIDRTRIHRTQGRRFFIDKMPNNFEHIPLIQLLLPEARIVDVRRHPMAAGFSAFKQLFARGQDFSYDLTDLGRYYADYAGLMAHFDTVLPGRIHRVIYENLIVDVEHQVEELLHYCGLPFEAACLHFHENDRAVRTVSSEQVRQPLYSHGLEHWRHFEAWLRPLHDAVGPWHADWRGSAFGDGGVPGMGKARR